MTGSLRVPGRQKGTEGIKHRQPGVLASRPSATSQLGRVAEGPFYHDWNCVSPDARSCWRCTRMRARSSSFRPYALWWRRKQVHMIAHEDIGVHCDTGFGHGILQQVPKVARSRSSTKVAQWFTPRWVT